MTTLAAPMIPTAPAGRTARPARAPDAPAPGGPAEFDTQLATAVAATRTGRSATVDEPGRGGRTPDAEPADPDLDGLPGNPTGISPAALAGAQLATATGPATSPGTSTSGGTSAGSSTGAAGPHAAGGPTAGSVGGPAAPGPPGVAGAATGPAPAAGPVAGPAGFPGSSTAAGAAAGSAAPGATGAAVSAAARRAGQVAGAAGSTTGEAATVMRTATAAEAGRAALGAAGIAAGGMPGAAGGRTGFGPSGPAASPGLHTSQPAVPRAVALLAGDQYQYHLPVGLPVAKPTTGPATVDSPDPAAGGLTTAGPLGTVAVQLSTPVLPMVRPIRAGQPGTGLPVAAPAAGIRGADPALIGLPGDTIPIEPPTTAVPAGAGPQPAGPQPAGQPTAGQPAVALPAAAVPAAGQPTVALPAAGLPAAGLPGTAQAVPVPAAERQAADQDTPAGTGTASVLSGLPAAGPAPASPAQPAAPASQAAQSGPAAQVVAVLHPLRSAPDGVHQLTVHLHPAELGPVSVRAEIRNGDIHLHLAGATEAARDALRMALPELRRDLQAAGFTAGSLDVQPDGRPGPDLAGQSGQFSQHQADQAGRGPHYRPAVQGPAATLPIDPPASGDGRLDLRV